MKYNVKFRRMKKDYKIDEAVSLNNLTRTEAWSIYDVLFKLVYAIEVYDTRLGETIIHSKH